jgi:Lamin Tail Domain
MLRAVQHHGCAVVQIRGGRLYREEHPRQIGLQNLLEGRESRVAQRGQSADSRIGEHDIIERALVNPRGDEPGKEVVVIGNTTTASVDLASWSIVDKNNKADVLRGVRLPAGKSRNVVLSGNGAQLSNKGGTITLRNPAGEQVHAASYSKEDAGQEDRYIRFNT